MYWRTLSTMPHGFEGSRILLGPLLQGPCASGRGPLLCDWGMRSPSSLRAAPQAGNAAAAVHLTAVGGGRVRLKPLGPCAGQSLGGVEDHRRDLHLWTLKLAGNVLTEIMGPAFHFQSTKRMSGLVEPRHPQN